MKRSRERILLAAAVAGTIAITTAGCSSAATSTHSAGKNMKIVVVSGPLSDPFFGAMKKGSEQAGKDLGVNVQYTAPADLNNLGPDLSRLEDAAIAAHPDAIVASEFLPDAQDGSLKRITAANIPMVFMNAGPNWQSLGAITYIGENPAAVGAQAGATFAKKGATKVLCVNHVPGNPTLEARCNGLEKAVNAAGGTTSVLNIPASQATDPTAVTNAISGALRSDPSINGVFTLGSSVAEDAVKALANANPSTIVGTTDLSMNVLQDVKQGKLAFAVDQQPYLQGYDAVLAAVQDVRFGLHPVGQVDTSPLMITKDNVDQTIKINHDNAGIRGAA